MFGLERNPTFAKKIGYDAAGPDMATQTWHKIVGYKKPEKGLLATMGSDLVNGIKNRFNAWTDRVSTNLSKTWDKAKEQVSAKLKEKEAKDKALKDKETPPPALAIGGDVPLNQGMRAVKEAFWNALEGEIKGRVHRLPRDLKDTFMRYFFRQVEHYVRHSPLRVMGGDEVYEHANIIASVWLRQHRMVDQEDHAPPATD